MTAAQRQYDEHRFDGVHLAAAWLEQPYPEDVFTPMTTAEVLDAVRAMNEVVPHASERMHALETARAIARLRGRRIFGDAT